jgi:predicted RNA-binding protein with TRAM domain
MSYRGGFGLDTIPVEMEKEYGVEVTELSKRGDGIARVIGFVIFVGRAETGLKARLRITNIGERFAKAELV